MLKYQFQFYLKDCWITFRMCHLSLVVFHPSYLQKPPKITLDPVVSCNICVSIYGATSHTDNDEAHRVDIIADATKAGGLEGFFSNLRSHRELFKS